MRRKRTGVAPTSQKEDSDSASSLVESSIDEAYFLQAASLQIGQGLRHRLVVGEFVHRDVHLRLR